MDFSNEPYVRIYTTITPTGRAWGFFGRCLMDQLIRAADRAGVIDLDPELSDLSLEMAVAVAIECGDTEWVKRHLPSLMATDSVQVMTHDGRTYLFLPKYIEAQTTNQSKSQSSRNYNEKRKALKRASELGFIDVEEEAESA